MGSSAGGSKSSRSLLRQAGLIASLKIYLREVLPERILEARIIARARMFQLLRIKRSSGYLIGPTNSANQATEWVRSLPGGQSLRISADPSSEWFHSDYEIKVQDRNQEKFRIELLESIFSKKSAILIESLRPIFALRKGRQGFAPRHSVDDLLLLRRMGKRVGVVFHGSDIRDPAAHLARNPYSPFRSSGTGSGRELALRPEAVDLAEKALTHRNLLPLLRKEKIPLFITTPDLFYEVPDAIWLPVVIDLPKLESVAQSSPLFTSPKLRVLYLPSKSWIKSSELITPVLEKLRDEGVIDYTNWVAHGPVMHDEIPNLLSQVDVVIDQFIGLSGVFALEAAAAGRIVMTYIDPAHTDHPTLPHINVNPETLEREVRRIAQARENALMQAQVLTSVEGRPQLTLTSVGVSEGVRAAKEFIEFYHDGGYSAEIIQSTLAL